MKQLLDKDLFFEELRQLFKDYEELESTKTTPENLKELVEKQSEVTLRVFGYLDKYTFDERIKLQEDRIKELEEALKVTDSNLRTACARLKFTSSQLHVDDIINKNESLLKQ